MQMCGECMKVYDESESIHVIVYDKEAGIAKSVPKEEAHLYE